MKSREKIIMGIFICLVGLIFVIPGYFKTVKPARVKIMNSAVTYALVSSAEVKSGYITGIDAFAEYTVPPDAYRESISQAGRFTRLKAGERVPIYYNIKDPADAFLADPLAVYRDASLLALFVVPIYFFGFSLIALGILKRDSFYDISGYFKNGIPPRVKTASKIISGLCVLLWILKYFGDIPACFHMKPYLFITLAGAIVLNVVSLVVLLKAGNVE